MNASMTTADNASASATQTASFWLGADVYVMSQRMSQAKHVAWGIEVEIRVLLKAHGLRTSHVEPDYERHREGLFKSHFHLATRCLVECTKDQIKLVTQKLQERLEESDALSRRVPVDEVVAFWNKHTPRN